MATSGHLFQTASIGTSEQRHARMVAYKLGWWETSSRFAAHLWQSCQGTLRMGDRALQKPLPAAATSVVHSIASWAPTAPLENRLDFVVFPPTENSKQGFVQNYILGLSTACFYIKQDQKQKSTTYTKNLNLKQYIVYITWCKFPSVFWKTGMHVTALWLSTKMRSGSPVLWCCSQNRC